MFGWLKNNLSRSTPPRHEDVQLVSEWAGLQGFSLGDDSSSARISQGGFMLSGKARGKPWKLVLGNASRDYVQGKELRARAELALAPAVELLITNRPLRSLLLSKRQQIEQPDFRASGEGELEQVVQGDPTYRLRYVDELRWMTRLPEVSWDSLPPEFWTRYCVTARDRQHAVALIDPNLAELMLAWPHEATTDQIPMSFMLLRGKAYMRMQYTPATMSTLQHAAIVFTSACSSAVGSLPASPQA